MGIVYLGVTVLACGIDETVDVSLIEQVSEY